MIHIAALHGAALHGAALHGAAVHSSALTGVAAVVCMYGTGPVLVVRFLLWIYSWVSSLVYAWVSALVLHGSPVERLSSEFLRGFSSFVFLREFFFMGFCIVSPRLSCGEFSPGGFSACCNRLSPLLECVSH